MRTPAPRHPRRFVWFSCLVLLVSGTLFANHGSPIGSATLGGNNWTLEVTSDRVSGDSPVIGSGFFKDAQIIFGMGLAYGSGPASVSVSSPVGTTDFQETGLRIEVYPGGRYDTSTSHVATESVSLAVESLNHALGRSEKVPLNFAFVRQTFAYHDTGNPRDDDYVIFKYTIHNPGPGAVDDLYTALVVDPDVVSLSKPGGDAGNDFVEYDAKEQMGRARSAPATPPSPGTRHPTPPDTTLEGGFILLGEAVGMYRPTVNGVGLSDPRTLEEWWDLLRGGIQHPEAVGPSDARLSLGTAAKHLGAGESQVVFFALLGGTRGNLARVAAAARARFAQLPQSARVPFPVVAANVVVKGNVVVPPNMDRVDPASPGDFKTTLTFPHGSLFDPTSAFCGLVPASGFVQNPDHSVTFSFPADKLDRSLRDGDEIICAGKLTTVAGQPGYWYGRSQPEIKRDLSTVTQLTFDPAGSSPNDSWGTWSPDGKKIAFASDRSENCALEGDPPPACGSGIWTLDLATGQLTRLTSMPVGDDVDAAPSWSNNGDIAFERAGGIFKVPASGGAVQQITATYSESGFARFDRTPRYSPDSSQIVFRRNAFGNPPQPGTHIWLMSAQGELGNLGQPAQPLAAAGAQDLLPFWAKDGLVYFTSNAPPSFNGFIFSIDPSAAQPREILQVVPTEAEVRELHATVFVAPGPDGARTLAFTSQSTGFIVLQSLDGVPETAQHRVLYFDPQPASLDVTLNTFDRIELSPDGASTLFGDGKHLYQALLPPLQ